MFFGGMWVTWFVHLSGPELLYLCMDFKIILQNCIPEPFPKQALAFKCLQYKSFENTVGKGEIARNEQYLLFPQYFIPIFRTLC